MNPSEYDISRMYDRGEITIMPSRRFGLRMRTTLMVIDDIYKKPSKRQLQKKALAYKGKYNMRDNNCKENHEHGLQKRIANHATQHTLRTMPNGPAKVHLAVKRAFYGNVLKMLKLA